MNILFLAYNVNIHSRTGDAVHVRELALNLAALGNKVSLVVGFNPDSKEDTSSLTNNSNIDLQYVKNPKIKYHRSHDVSILSLCFNIVKNNSFDIIYERNFSCRIGVILSKIARTPLVVEINGLIDEEAEMQGRHVSLIRGEIGKRLRRLFFIQASKIVSVTDGIKEELMNSYRIPSGKIVVIPNGANTNLFKPMNQKEVKTELDLAQECKYICFVGNLAPWQGVEYIIKAAPLVIKSIPKARFLIVGDGVCKQELQNCVKEMDMSNYFLFTGSVSYDSVPLYMNASDVCMSIKKPVLPGSPLKVFEYMACGKPVIATKESAYGFEILEEFGAGLLVDQDNPEDVSNAIIHLLKNPEETEKMGLSGRKLVIENFGWKNTAQKVEEICSSTLK